MTKNIAETMAIIPQSSRLKVLVILTVIQKGKSKVLFGAKGLYLLFQAALKALMTLGTRSALVQGCGAGNALEHLAKQKEVTLLWVPGHSEVPENEMADELARHGSETPCQGPERYLEVTRGYINRALNDWAHEKFSKDWRRSGCKQAHDLFIIEASNKTCLLS
ncbi:hypothetical protein NQ317_010209 [Molorchus minor]|uniref:RNase H type-1 domain-containing protein n=1 Tax=Molorchus minor TaxID=1323400 RepID=A0ABQ9JRJ2_9CUCU|nr:hypothetical protein NQ317_010209 [Molorchus minor]